MTSQTLTRRILRTTAANTASAAAALASWAVVAGLAPVAGEVAAPQVEPDRVTVLVERHGCWSGTAPLGAPEPTRAVVTPVHGRAHVVPAERGYAIWLGDAAGTLHAFCP